MSKRLDNYLKTDTYKENNDNPLKNSGEIIKFREKLNENPMDPYSQHEIKSTGIPEETKCLMSEDSSDSKDDNQYKDNDQLAKVKGRIDENPMDPYSQHEIKSIGIPEETQSLTGESTEASNLFVMEL